MADDEKAPNFLGGMTGYVRQAGAFIASVGFPVAAAIFLGVLCWVLLARVAPALDNLTKAVEANTTIGHEQGVEQDVSLKAWIRHMSIEEDRDKALKTCLRGATTTAARLACVDNQ